MRIDQRLLRRKRAISMVPLIDVVFILLLFFMLSTSLIREREVAVDFPAAGAGEAALELRLIRLEAEDGTIALEGRRSPSADPDALRRLVAAEPDAAYAVDPAPDVSTQALIALLDRLALAGARNVSLAPEPP